MLNWEGNTKSGKDREKRVVINNIEKDMAMGFSWFDGSLEGTQVDAVFLDDDDNAGLFIEDQKLMYHAMKQHAEHSDFAISIVSTITIPDFEYPYIEYKDKHYNSSNNTESNSSTGDESDLKMD